MKNFRKVLALILVVATLFSFVAMASAKSLEDYSDANDVDYIEAVEVLSALGIINGYTDGSFKPDANIEREEMAKMVAVLRNAGEFEADLYASANKFADAKGSWAEGYIAYCAQLGIVAGRNASTFDPDGLVTGVEVLKMLLCTLGYDAKEQSYVGANWQVNVVRDARKSDLLDDLKDVDLYKPATREQAAQMFLNALKADMVYGYLSENIVNVTNSLYFAENGKLLWPATNDTKYDGYELAYCNAILSDVPLFEIFGKVVKAVAGLDCFGRPSTVWTITNKYGASVLKKSYADKPEYVFTDKISLESELSGMYNYASQNFEKLHLHTYVDGIQNYDYSYLAGNNETEIRDDLRDISKYLSGNGVRIEVFFEEDGLYVVVINTYIGKVESVLKRKGTVTLDNGDTFKNTLGLEKDDYVLYHKCAGDTTTAGLPGNHMDAIKLYDRNGNEQTAVEVPGNNPVLRTISVHDVQLAVPTVEEIIHVSKADKYYDYRLEESYFQTADQKFEYAKNYGNRLKELVVKYGADYLTNLDFLLTIGDIAPKYNTYDVYVDEYGYVMFVEPSKDKYDYEYGYIVEDSHDEEGYRIENGVSVSEKTFDIVDFEGNLLADVVAEADTWKNTFILNDGYFNDGTDDKYEPGYLVRYYINEDGEAEVNDPVNDVAKTAPVDAYVVPGVAQIYGTNTPVYGDKETKYMIRTYNWATGEYTYDVYVGYNNLPSVLFSGKTVDGSVRFRTLQYLIGNEDDSQPDVATHVFIDCDYAGANELFYVLGKASVESETIMYGSLRGYNVYAALVDGEKAYIAATDLLGNATEGAPNLGLPVVGKGLYRAKMTHLSGETIHGLKIYVALDDVNPVTWQIEGAPVNGLMNIYDIVNGYVKKQLSDDAVIHVIHTPATEDEYWNANYATPEYVIFEGETRDEDFNDFFGAGEWARLSIYTTTKKVGDKTWGQVEEITEMWIELIELKK